MKHYELRIDGMNCDHCVRTVRSVLSGLPESQVDKVELGKAILGLEGVFPEARLRALLEEEGFQLKAATPVE